MTLSSVEKAGSEGLQKIFGTLLGLQLQNLNVPIGVQCSSVALIGAAGGSSW